MYVFDLALSIENFLKLSIDKMKNFVNNTFVVK